VRKCTWGKRYDPTPVKIRNLERGLFQKEYDFVHATPACLYFIDKELAEGGTPAFNFDGPVRLFGGRASRVLTVHETWGGFNGSPACGR
jgi:hypothetical protein